LQLETKLNSDGIHSCVCRYQLTQWRVIVRNDYQLQHDMSNMRQTDDCLIETHTQTQLKRQRIAKASHGRGLSLPGYESSVARNNPQQRRSWKQEPQLAIDTHEYENLARVRTEKQQLRNQPPNCKRPLLLGNQDLAMAASFRSISPPEPQI